MLIVRRRIVAAVVLLVAATISLGVSTPSLAVYLAAPAFVALVTGSRFRTDRGLEPAITFGALVVGVLLARVFAVEQGQLSEVLSARTLFFVCPLVLTAGARAALRAPTYGHRGTLGMALVGFAGAGRAKMGSPYLVAAALFLVLASVALAITDESRALPAEGRGRHFAKLLAGLAITAAVAAAGAIFLPVLHASVVDRISEGFRDRSGFSNELSLSSLDGLMQSDRVVARVRNGSPEYLRGATFSRYTSGHWFQTSGTLDGALRHGSDHPDDPAGYVAVEYASKPERYFVPLDAVDVVASSGTFFENKLGLRWQSSADYAKRVWYRPGASDAIAARPSEDDGQLPERMVPKLDAILDEFGVDRNAPKRERIARIEDALLEHYTYSLEFERPAKGDPVLDFLTTNKRGHCEYFASAMVLLARAAGVRARVVTGFRVLERSPIAHYAIVRERNAHSWVEVWLDEKWETYDPTPAGGDVAMVTPWSSALVDFVSTSWEKVDDFLAARTPFQLTLALVGLVGLLFLSRVVRARRQKGAAKVAPVRDEPLPAFVALERALAAKGVARPPSETLEAFAERTATSAGASVASAIRAYADHRYGGVGDERAIIEALEHAARGVP